MAKSAPTTRSGADPSTRPTKVAVTPAHSQSGHGSEDSETNIQVVVRCRGRSRQEMESSSPVIVTSNGAKSNQISIETDAQKSSSFGVANPPPIRTYPFDLVFGPEADQALIYHEVVSPILDQVLMGYNCTLFAYGQTGTGKTYTMHGDLTPTPMGNPSIHAGMIPRVLFRLFHYLETSGTDFSVKISYVELYNEELRDLLANDLSAPVGTSQPMGMSKDLGKNTDGGGLKIYEDASKRGVCIQGLEEISVKDCEDALALLTKGSHRRQTAATKFNDHSSRSHSIFSITVHTKEPGIGKLNLVDLAGSENIGRSGAQNTRAREAGMINQSLLTLGRVINALVEKASHVPYRESKLTRLLQDSLGGRTKTSIVATVSPARCNLEETLSTLDYAMHAKSIRNKPELNQRMTRNSLLQEYLVEIDRLKLDLEAARDKNGIFLSEESWKIMSAEKELHKTELDEAKKQVAIVEIQRRAVQDEFDQSIGRLKQRETELKDTRQQLQETQEDLIQKTAELNAVKRAFEEEVVFRQAFQHSEHALDGVACGLKTIAAESISDVGGLFDKLERKSEVMAANTNAVVSHGKTIASATRTLSLQLNEFVKTSTSSTSKLCQEAKRFRSSELSLLASHSKRLHELIKQLASSLGVIHSQDTSEEAALAIVKKMIKETHDTFKDGFGKWGETLSSTCSDLCLNVEKTGLVAFGDAERALKLTSQVVEGVLRDAFKFIEGERQAILIVKAIASDAANGEINRLRQQNETLTRMLETERANADTAKNDLIQRISSMLSTFAADRDSALRASIQSVQHDNQQGEKAMKSFLTKQDQVLASMEAEGTTIATTMEKRNGDVKRARDGAYKNLNTAKSSLTSGLSEMGTTVTGSIKTYSGKIQQQVQEMSAGCSKNLEDYHCAKRIRLDTTKTLGERVESEYHPLDEAIASTSRNTKTFVDQVTSLGSSLNSTMETFDDSASSQLSSVGAATKSLATEGARPDVSSGSTPRKRPWNYVDEWDLAGSREDVLKAWRNKGISNVGSETFVAEHLPLPDDEGQAEAEVEGSDVESRSVRSTTTVLSQPSMPNPPPPPPRTKNVSREQGKGKSTVAETPLVPLENSQNVYMTRRRRRDFA
ncbi:kinesin 2 [Hymenopellis radicata]|nr:kinesin 2 [Hymenopellis radicata]